MRNSYLIMNPFYVLFYGVFWCYVQSLPADVFTNLTTCGYVKPIFETKNISTRIPSQPIDGKSLSICKADKSCCTSEMESNLMNLVKKDYQSLLQQNAQSVQGILASTAIHFTEYIHQMLLKSESKTKQVLRDMLGVSSPALDEEVRRFTNDLYQYILDETNDDSAYYTSTQIQFVKNVENKLAQLTTSFFARLFPILYPMAMNETERELDTGFVQCLQTHVAEINPFSEITKSLEKDISKTFVATKVLIDALEFGSRMLNFSNLLVISESSFNVNQCYSALLRMSYCSRCDGYPSSVKPCAGYCLNVMRGCLAQQAAELDSAWSSYYESVDRLMSMVNRGQSLVCLEDLLRSLDSRIAEPVQYFKHQNGSLHSKVKVHCGMVRWSNSTTRNSAKLPVSPTDWRLDEDDSNFRSTLLSSKIRQFQESIPMSRGFYSNLAETLCSDDSFAEKRETASCWNGQRVAEYAKTVLPIQITSQKYNPEVPWTSSTTDTAIIEMVEKLRHTEKLVLSQVVMNPESDSLYQPGADDGSGSGFAPISTDEQLTDDEDSEPDGREQGSGSGEVPITADPTDGTIIRENPDIRKLPTDPDVTSTNVNQKTGSKANIWTANVLTLTACTVYWIIF